MGKIIPDAVLYIIAGFVGTAGLLFVFIVSLVQPPDIILTTIGLLSLCGFLLGASTIAKYALTTRNKTPPNDTSNSD